MTNTTPPRATATSAEKLPSMRSLSITSQIQFVLVLLVVLSLLVTARWLIAYSAGVQETQVRQIQQMRSDAVAQDATTYLQERYQTLDTLVRYAELFELTAGGQQQVLAQLIRADNAYQAMAVVDANGRLTTAVAGTGHAIPDEWRLPSIWSTALATTQPSWGGVYHRPAQTDSIDLFLPHPQNQGGLAVRFDLGFLAETLRQTPITDGAYSYLVDEHGHVLASSLGGVVLTPAPPQDLTAVYNGWQGAEVLGTQSVVPITEWRVVVEIPTMIAFAPIREATFGMGVALTIAATVAALLGIYLARQLLAPLHDFSQVATRISQGDLHSRVTLTSYNEFGLLARALNSMADQIQALIRHMEQRVDELHTTYLALQESEARFRIIADSSPIPLIIAQTQDGQILYANPQAADLLGYGAEQLIQLSTRQFYARPDERVMLLGQLAAEGQIRNYETQFVRQDGGLIWVSLVVTPIVFQGLNVLFTAVQDVTEQRVAAEALKAYSERLEDMVAERTHALSESNAQLVQAKNTAEAASQAKTVFLANVSHELRTPLNAILGFTQLLQRSEDITPEDLDYLGIIYQSGRHLLNLINEVLEMSKIEAGQMVVSKNRFDLHQLLNSLYSMFIGRADDKGLYFQVVYEPRVPQFIVADERKLTQVLLNLLSNALKFTERGRVTLLASANPDGEQHVRLRFEVRDTGVGISSAEQALLFRPFTQTSSGQQAQEGTGLGLALSQQLVRLLGGEMQVESELGRGSCFFFAIRVGQTDAADAAPVVTEKQVVRLAPHQPTYRILIVEDRAENRLLLGSLLGMVGFTVQMAPNGHAGILMAKAWQPHFVFMDIRMPIMDGYEATRRMKEEMAKPPIVVALTAGAFDGEKAQALAAGCDDFVAKPFQEEELWQVLKTWLGVEFEYKDVPTAEEPPTAEATLTAALRQQLPPAWCDLLYQAAITADQQKMLHLIHQIQPQHPTTAELLTTFVRRFATRELLDWLNPPSSHHDAT